MLGKVIELPRIMDPRGNLTVAEQLKNVPFEIRRVYWTYDIPSGEHRGGHAHKQCRELIIAVSGSFTVTLTNGQSHRPYLLNHPYQALLVEAGVWRTHLKISLPGLSVWCLLKIILMRTIIYEATMFSLIM